MLYYYFRCFYKHSFNNPLLITFVILQTKEFLFNFVNQYCEFMNNRLKQFLTAENISQSSFADKMGIARASVSHILSGRNKPGFDFLETLSKLYPAINLEWLITGRGRMYKQDQAPELKETNSLFTEMFENQAPIPQSNLKQIEKVVIFYNDNSFKEII